jgi:hypothetical protein
MLCFVVLTGVVLQIMLINMKCAYQPKTIMALAAYQISGMNGGLCCEEQLAIDDVLSILASKLFGESSYSGSIETYWRNGGMQTPSLRGWNKSSLGSAMKSELPSNYTGWAVWNLNGGIKSGKVKLLSIK